MPTRMQRLVTEMHRATAWRGHRMRLDRNYWGRSPRRRLYRCINPGCTAIAVVITHPLPNEIDIGGDAVAMDCPVPPEEERE
jgi:hypothetical protein